MGERDMLSFIILLFLLDDSRRYGASKGHERPNPKSEFAGVGPKTLRGFAGL